IRELRFLTATGGDADVLFPAPTYAEKHGTVCNLEGRVQQIEAAVRGPGGARGDGAILLELSARLGAEWSYGGWEEIFADARAAVPGLEIGAFRTPPPLQGDWPANGALPARSADLVLITGEVLFDRGSMTARSPAIADLAGPPLVAPAAGDRLVARDRCRGCGRAGVGGCAVTGLLVEALIKSIVLLLVLLTATAYLTLLE